MKNYLLYSLLLSALFACRDKKKYQDDPAGSRIIVEMKLPPDYELRDMTIQRASTYYVIQPKFVVRRPEIVNGYAKWVLYSDTALLVNLSRQLGNNYFLCIFEPGDSIRIGTSPQDKKFTGNSITKFELAEELLQLRKESKLPKNKDFTKVTSEADYWQWNDYLNAMLDSSSLIFAKYEKRITPKIFDAIKQDFYSDIEYMRMLKFDIMVNNSKTLNISNSELEIIFDSTMHNQTVQWLQNYTSNPKRVHYYYAFVRKTVERRRHFNYDDDTLKSVTRKIAYVKLAKQLYKGEVLQSCLTYLITNQGLKEHTFKDGHEPTIDSLLKDYYAQPGYTAYKEYVHNYEKKIQGWIAQKKN